MGEWPLHRLPLGEEAVVLKMEEENRLSLRLREIGVTEGTRICRKRQAPLGDPSIYMVRGSALAIRAQDAAHILVRPVHIPVSGGFSGLSHR